MDTAIQGKGTKIKMSGNIQCKKDREDVKMYRFCRSVEDIKQLKESFWRRDKGRGKGK